MFRLFGQGSNHVVMKFESVEEAGVSTSGKGVSISVYYEVQASNEVIEDIKKCESVPTASVGITYNINGTEEEDKGYVDVKGSYAELFDYKELPEGTYNIKVYVPETIEGDVEFCVYAYSPETGGYTEEIGCYSTYSEAEEEAKKHDAVVAGELVNVVTSGSKEIDMGKVTIGPVEKKPTPPPPKKKEPIWYPGKFLKKFLGRG